MENILKKYDNLAINLQELKDKTAFLLIDLMNANSINVHQITSRLKTRDSLSKKISQKQGYTCLEDITDIVGCRIITYFEDEVDKIATIIEREFDIDPENSIDKRKIEFDRFGYLSLHYVVKLNSKRLKLAEYKKFKEIKFEIQIRSILQHSWAEIEHDIGYKGKFSIPSIVKRRFSRIAALLETADIEFVRLRDELSLYEKNIRKDIAADPTKVNLDKASLISFITNNKDLRKADNAVAEILNIDLKVEVIPVEERISLLQFGGIKTVFDLDKLYSDNFNCIIEYSKHWRGQQSKSISSKGYGVNGISIYDAANYQIAKTRKKEEFASYLKDKFKDPADKIIGKAKMIEKDKMIEREVARCYESLDKTNKNCH